MSEIRVIAVSAASDIRVTVLGTPGPRGPVGLGVPAGGDDGQLLAKASGADYDTEWVDPEVAAWGGITGILSDQTDLQAALDGKATSAQGALADTALQPGAQIPWTDVTGKPTFFSGAYGDLTGVPSTFAPSAHTHPASQITDFDTAVAAAPAVAANTAKVTNATHTGDAAGNAALTLQPAAITGKATVTLDDADFVLVSDTSDAGALKKVPASDFGGGGGDVVGPGSATDDALAGFDGVTGKLIKVGALTLTELDDLAAEIITARGDRSQLGLRIGTISNFASPNAGAPIAGLYYDNSFHSTAMTATTGAANRLELAPFYTSVTLPIDEIGVAISTAVAAALMRCVIYGSDADGWPDELLFEGASDLDCSTTGYKSHSLSFSFDSGRQYWVGVRCSSTAAYRAVALSSAVNFGTNGNTATSFYSCLRKTVTFADPAPDPFGFSSGTLTANVPPPSLRMRR